MFYKTVTIGFAAVALGAALSSIPVLAQQVSQMPAYNSQGATTSMPTPPAGAQQPATGGQRQPGGPMPAYTSQGTVTGVPVNTGPQGRQPTSMSGGQPAGPTGAPISPGGAGSHANDVGGPSNMGPSYNSSGKRVQ